MQRVLRIPSRRRGQDFRELCDDDSAKQEFFLSSEEQESHATTVLGESSSTFIERVSGKAVGVAALGTNTDLALSTWQENVGVMVVDTRTISRDTADEVLEKTVQYAAVAGERDKTKMVCAIGQGHYDLGVLHTLLRELKQCFK